jgi:hypothetical protein
MESSTSASTFVNGFESIVEQGIKATPGLTAELSEVAMRGLREVARDLLKPPQQSDAHEDEKVVEGEKQAIISWLTRADEIDYALAHAVVGKVLELRQGDGIVHVSDSMAQ